MKKHSWWLITPLALLLVAAADYPGAIFDPTSPATKRNSAFTQSEQNQVIDEIGAVETALGANFEQRGVNNLLSNGSVEAWTKGTSVAPDSWTLSGTGAAVARQSDGQDGSYSAQITAGTATSKLSQDALATISASVNTRLRGAWAVMTARVKSSTASTCRLEIDDGVGQTQSTYHTGGGSWELLTVERSLDASAAILSGKLRNEKTDSASTCRFDSVMLLEGRFRQRAFVDNSTAVRVICAAANFKTNSGTAETDLHSCTLPAGALPAVGKGIRVTDVGNLGANGNTKIRRIYLDTVPIGYFSTTVSGTNSRVFATAIRTDATHLIACDETLSSNNAVGCQSVTFDPTLSFTIKSTGQGGASTDINSDTFIVEMLN